jgi:hypothetical protein
MNTMKKIWAHIGVLLLLSTVFGLSTLSLTHAQTGNVPADTKTSTDTKNPPTGATGGFSVKIANPLGGNIDTLDNLTKLVLDTMVKVLSPIIVLMIIWTGFRYIKAQGNSKEITEVHNALMWVLIGAAVILGAKVIALALEGTISQL